jgi:hypothetical protein
LTLALRSDACRNQQSITGGGAFVGWTRTANGERQSENFERKCDAAFALKKYETEAYEIRKGLRPVPVEKVPHTFGDVADHWLMGLIQFRGQ